MKSSLKMQIKYDIKIGIINEWKTYLFFTLVVIILCANIVFEAYNRNLDSPKLADYLTKLFCGMKDFSDANRTQKFLIPEEWLMIQMFFIIMISRYPKMDFDERGYQVLIRSHSKKMWWISKCVWGLCSAVLYYGIMYLVIVVFAFFSGGLSLETTSDIWKIGLTTLSKQKFIAAVFIMPAVASFTYAIAEMLISFLASPIIAVLITISYLVMSAYWCNPGLIGNYTMLLRNKEIVGNQGVNSEIGFVICMISIFFCMVIGYKHVGKIDILINNNKIRNT